MSVPVAKTEVEAAPSGAGTNEEATGTWLTPEATLEGHSCCV